MGLLLKNGTLCPGSRFVHSEPLVGQVMTSTFSFDLIRPSRKDCKEVLAFALSLCFFLRGIRLMAHAEC